MKILVIPIDAPRHIVEHHDSELCLKFMKNLVGGEIDFIKMNDYEMMVVRKQTVGLKINTVAEFLAKRELNKDIEIRGNAILISETDLFK